jgi:carbamoyltransferase
MRQRVGIFGASHPWLGQAGYRLGLTAKAFCATQKFFTSDSAYAQERAAAMREKLRTGEPVYLLGLGPGGHNSGIALIEVTRGCGIRILCNNEEERFSGVKHDAAYPRLSIEALIKQMDAWGIAPSQVHACLASWDYARLAALFTKLMWEELPDSLTWLRPDAMPAVMNIMHVWQAYMAPKRLGAQLGLAQPMPIIGLRHHDNHAYLSYGASPFSGSPDPVIVTVLDSCGDDGAISLYVARQGELKMVSSNRSVFDSLGLFYSIISSTQGGWTILSSEGRYMGAAAWGEGDRLTNPFYRQLRQIFHFADGGRVYLNRALANWPRRLEVRPYTADLTAMIGPPIPKRKMWNPDAVLRPDDIQHAEMTQERLDKAAATQLVFEDVLFHIVEHLIRTTGSNKLVLTGGTALNAVANMRLLERFDEWFYERYLGRKNTRLHLWVPPAPGDAGVTMGAAYHFAWAHGVPSGEPLRHAFYCGPAPSTGEIREALGQAKEIGWLPLGDITSVTQRESIADLLAYIISNDGVMGVFQGAAETGPRALGHRSILANPCNPRTLAILNKLVKHREAVRPLAPMATYRDAQRWFALSPGASDDGHNAYNYMVLTALARPEAHSVIPAVIHKDGTSRVQIVRPESDPFVHAYLKAMGRRLGVEVSVNTSLNVCSPIVQTPVQALDTLKRSKGMDGLLVIGADGSTFLAWHDVHVPPKDPRRLRAWLNTWQEAGSPVA